MRKVDALDLAEWEAFESIEGPLGPARLDLLVAYLAAATIAPNLKDDSDPEKIADYLRALAERFPPKWDDPLAPPPDFEQQLAREEEAVARKRAEVVAKLEVMFGVKRKAES